MTIITTIENQVNDVLTTNQIYRDYQARWQYLLESYMGGEEYRLAGHLTRYQLETDAEYAARCRATYLENHCASVVQVYNSFLFRETPERDLAQLGNTEEAQAFLRDADLDGRSLDAFMKDVAAWSSVFGHCWIIMAKPNVGALTLAEEQAQGVRPYVSLVTPMTVMDWRWGRQPSGRFELTYLKYIEEINDTVQTIKEWTRETVMTWKIDVDNRTVEEQTVEINELGRIPAVIAYNMRSPVRGVGVSDITDIADAQRAIYNCNSEIEQSIRIDSHPSLVKTPETQAGIGAGSIIHMPENLDPGLKPYILEYNGASVSAILSNIEHAVEAIDKMANTGSVRASESRTLSGVAMQTEFQLLNARLSEKADNLELAEEQMWTLFAQYQGTNWMGSVEYPGSFNIRDEEREFEQLKTARDTATDPAVLRVIDYKLVEALGKEGADVLTWTEGLPAAYVPATTEGVPEGQNCANCEYYDPITSNCSKWDQTVQATYWCRAWDEVKSEEQ
jgi:hypothetical protein